MTSPFKRFLALPLSKCFTLVLLMGPLGTFDARAIEFSEMRDGITLDAVTKGEEAKGNRLVMRDEGKNANILRNSDNRWVGVLRFCKGYLYEHSEVANGGVAAFIKRVAQLNRESGKAEVEVESKMLSVGEYNMLEFSWRDKDQVVRLTYFPESQGSSESQWLSKAMPSICMR